MTARILRLASEVRLTLVDGLKFDVTTGSGHTIRIDTPDVSGGEASAPSPMELQLVALGGCGAMDIISILRKMRQDVTGYDVTVTAVRSPEHPRVYTSAVLTHRFAGVDISEDHVRRAIYLSMSKYCPVLAMLSPGVSVSGSYEIVNGAGLVVTKGTVTLEEPVPPIGER